MPLEIEFDATDCTPESLDSAGQVPEGWYPAVLKDIYDDANKPGTTVFEYELTGRGFAGFKVFDRITDPNFADSDRSAMTLRKKLGNRLKRLGLLTGEEKGPVKIELLAALGKPFVLHMERETKEEDDPVTGRKVRVPGKYVNISFAGVYPPDYDVKKLPKNTPQEVLSLFSAGQGTAATPSLPGMETGNAGANGAGRTHPQPQPAAPAPAPRVPVAQPAAGAVDLSDL